MKGRLRIGRASAGLGVFATVPIRRGSCIAEYTGRRMSRAKADQLYTRYIFYIGEKHAIDGSPKSNAARYINHGCHPNAWAWARTRLRRVFIVASRRIRPGEEITYDYGKNYFDTFITKRHCRCKSCRRRRSEARQK